jgi:hypothetical protein
MKRQVDIPEFFANLPTMVNTDTRLVHRGRFFEVSMGWGIDSDLWVINVLRGKISGIASPDDRVSRSPAFTVKAPLTVWTEFSKEAPRFSRTSFTSRESSKRFGGTGHHHETRV